MKHLTEEQIVENLEKLNEGKLNTYLYGSKNYNYLGILLFLIVIVILEGYILRKYPELDLFMCMITGGIIGAYFAGNRVLYIGSTQKKLLFVETKWSSYEYKRGLVIEKKAITEIKRHKSLFGCNRIIIKYIKDDHKYHFSYIFYNKVYNKNLIFQEDNAIKYLEILDKYSN